jgi:hypothetical protein
MVNVAHERPPFIDGYKGVHLENGAGRGFEAARTQVGYGPEASAPGVLDGHTRLECVHCLSSEAEQAGKRKFVRSRVPRVQGDSSKPSLNQPVCHLVTVPGGHSWMESAIALQVTAGANESHEAGPAGIQL